MGVREQKKAGDRCPLQNPATIEIREEGHFDRESYGEWRIRRANQDFWDRDFYRSELSRVRAEVTELQGRLEALKNSPSWRLTRPLRRLAAGLRPARSMASLNDRESRPQKRPVPSLDYQQWIASEEGSCLQDLQESYRKRHAHQEQRLGLVLAAWGEGSVVPRDVLEACPAECRILILRRDGAATSPVGIDRVVERSVSSDCTRPEMVALALATLDSDLVCFVDARQRLSPHALPLAAAAAAHDTQLDMLFADEDWIGEDGSRGQPFFKPGWDAELQRGRDLVGPFVFFRTVLVRAAQPIDGPAWLYDLANQIAARTRPERIHHIPAVLCHRTALVGCDPGAIRKAAAAQLRRERVRARVQALSDGSRWHRVGYDLPDPAPLVSIIVPTRDRHELLRVCAEGVLHRTDYSRLELLIVDNSSEEPETLSLLEALAKSPRVRVLRRPGLFNWSSLNNAAAAEATGDVFVLLNNDIAVLEPDWLHVLVSHAVQPGVGAVGAKLVYPGGLVQHAGLTTDRAGNPRHVFRYAPSDDTGPFDLMGLARQVWAVTGACLGLSRAAFSAVGGLNEALPVAYNDVDLCLRLTALGYRIIWTPWCALEHREGGTRAPDHAEGRRDRVVEEFSRLTRDWGALAYHDPFLNPNLELIGDQLSFHWRT